MADNIIIDFQINDEGLAPAEDRLQALGTIDSKMAGVFKTTNTELAKRVKVVSDINAGTQTLTLSATKEQTIYNKLVTSLKTLSGETKKAVQSMLTLPPANVSKAFDSIGVSVDQYVGLLSKAEASTAAAGASTETLRSQLKVLTNEIQQLTVAGDVNSETFQKLTEQAGALREAIDVSGKAIKNAASDSGTLEAVLGSVEALAGGFVSAEGAIALFGGEGKDLQETLIKVNASMAILQGLQGLLAAAQEKGAISLAILNVQEKIAIVQTQLLTLADSEYVVVAGLATGATRILNAVLAANPIGIVILAIVALGTAIGLYTSKATEAAKAQANLTTALFQSNEQLNAFADGLKRGNEKIVSDLEKAGARQSDIQKQNIETELALQRDRVDEINNLNKVIAENEKSSNEDTQKKVQEARAQQFKLEEDNQVSLVKLYTLTNETSKQLTKEALDDQLSSINAQLVAAKEGSAKQLKLQKDAAKAQAAVDLEAAGQDPQKRFEIQAALNKQLIQLEVDFQKRKVEVQKQAIDSQLILVRDDIQTEYMLRTKALALQLKADLLNTKLSEDEKKALRKKAHQEQLLLDRTFSEEDRKKAIQAEVDKNQAALDTVKLNDEDRLALTEQNIAFIAQIEIDATHNNANKVKEIIAKRDADIKAAHLAFIEKQLADELSLLKSNTDPQLRAIARQETLNKEALDKRKISNTDYYNGLVKLIDDNTKLELAAGNAKLIALKKELDGKIISQTKYDVEYAALIDDQVKIVEDGEERKRLASEETKAKIKKDQQEVADFIINTAGAIGNILFDAFQNSLDAQSQKLDAQKQKIEDLKAAGKISDKEASQRLKQLAAEEAKLKREQAQKDKEQAIFNAIINTAAAVVKAYATVGPIAGPVLAAIAAAIGAAQIAVIASRPIPNFFVGKKDKYEGPGRVGESGAEIIEQNGSMRVVKKEEIVWLGANDKVYNPSETSRILESRATARKVDLSTHTVNNNSKIDYEKMGAAVGKHVKTNVYVDGILQQEIEHNAFTTYLNNRRR